MTVTPLFCTSARTISLDEVDFTTVGFAFAAVGKLARERRVQGIFALDQITSSTSSLTSTGGGQTFIDDCFGFARRLFKVACKQFSSNVLYDRAYLGIV